MSDNTPKIDIRPDHLQIVRDILQKHVPKYEVWAFGSRAKWLAKEYSDLDLCILADTALSFEQTGLLREAFEESDLPYKVDIVDWATTSESFRKIIEKDKIVVQKLGKLSKTRSDWKLGFLDELIDFTPKRGIKKGVLAPFIAMADLPENTKNISNIGQKDFSGGGSKFKNGDTIFARITPCLQNGKTAKVSGLDKNEIAHGSTEFIVFGAKHPDFDQDYIYYLSRLPEFRAFAISRMQGSTGRQRVAWQDLAQWELNIPPKNKRQVIGKFLASFDEKIELNRQINQTLEAMAQALFKSWFVDFDPVIDNALDAGNIIPESLQARAELRQAVRGKADFKPLPDDIRNAFPNAFEESELGWIPKGWSYEVIKSHCVSVQNGGTPRRNKEEYWLNGVIPWLTSGEVRQSIVAKTNNFISEEGMKNSSAKWVAPKSTLVALYGATAGEVSINANALTTNQAVCALIPKTHYEWFNYLAVSLKIDYFKNNAVGSAQQNISKGMVEESVVISPTNDIAMLFNKLVEPYFNKIVNNLFSNEELTKLRDTLLPKLISGELSLADVELD